MDLVFKALADSSRRALLDRLHSADGQTLKQLCTDLAMTRQAVTKHLALLEGANLITITWRGREKLHFLNPVPLQRISARWIGKYERPQTVSRPASPHRILPATAPTPSETEGENRWANLHAL
jgi:DNA-binding transcriptional ArsR family regulator